jgi:hypothetical protein
VLLNPLVTNEFHSSELRDGADSVLTAEKDGNGSDRRLQSFDNVDT